MYNNFINKYFYIRMAILIIYLSFIILPLSGFSDSDLGIFTFPSKNTRISSASGSLIASYSDPGPNQDGVHAYRFSISNSSGKEIAGFTFLRSIEAAWYDSSDELFVNNYIGSNLTDCLVLESVGRKIQFKSLSEILNNNPRSGPMEGLNIKPPEKPNNSHYYLKCERWIKDHSLKVILAGTTDAGGNFRYDFIFDVDKGKFTTAR